MATTKPTRIGAIINVAFHACREADGEFDAPMADAFQAAYKLRAEDKRLALTILRAKQDAEWINAMWLGFQTYTHAQLCAHYELRDRPESWFPESFLAWRRSVVNAA